MIKKLLQQSNDPVQSKKTWKKVRESKLKASIRKHQNEDRMDLEHEGKKSHDDNREVPRRGMDIEENPMGEVKKLISELEINFKSVTSSSSDSMMEENRQYKTNQEQFDGYYGVEFSSALRRNMPNLEGFLEATRVSEGLRAKMIDWMQEVINYFRPESDDYTFFRSVVIMDLFLKNNQRTGSSLIQDSDVHLIGLTSMFMASKYEDNRHIPILDLIKNACKDKFSVQNIHTMEWEVCLAIGFNCSIPTHLELLDSILSNTFEDTDSGFFHQIRYFAIYLMKKALYFKELIWARMDMFALGCAVLSVNANFDSEVIRNISNKTSIRNIKLDKHTVVGL